MSAFAKFRIMQDMIARGETPPAPPSWKKFWLVHGILYGPFVLYALLSSCL